MNPIEPHQPERPDEPATTPGDASFEVLVADYQPMLLCYLKSLVRDDYLAEDLMQESFVAAHRAIGKFDANSRP